MGYQQGFHTLEMSGIQLASVLWMEELPQRSMHRLALLFDPLGYELAISRSNRGGVVVIMASCMFELHQCDQYFCYQNAHIDSHTPLIPLHQTFLPLSNVKALENVQMNTQIFLFTLPTGVLPVQCWVNDGQFTLLALPQPHSTESVPLGWQWCTWPTWPAQLYRNDSPLSEQ